MMTVLTRLTPVIPGAINDPGIQNANRPLTISEIDSNFSDLYNFVLGKLSKSGDTLTGNLDIVGGFSLTGNATFSGTAQRFLIKTDGAQADRFAFQSTATNGNTRLWIYPSGTGNITGVAGHTSASDFTNYNAFDLAVLGGASQEVRLSSNAAGTATAYPITFRIGASEQMRLNTTGLGIGTTPEGKLHAVTSGSSTQYLFDSTITSGTFGFAIRSTGESGSAHPILGIAQWRSSFPGNQNVGQIRFDGLTTAGTYTTFAEIYATATGANSLTGAATSLAFRTSDGTGQAQERMLLTSSGNLGIGIAPTSKLEVWVPGTTGSTSIMRLSRGVGYGTTEFKQYYTSGTDYGLTIGNTLSDLLTLNLSSGNLGIGTSLPSTKLDVNGNAALRLPSIGGSVDLQFPYFGASNAKTILRATGTSDWRQTLTIQMNTAQSDSAPVDVLTISNSGNLGLGVTPSAWGSGTFAIDIGSGSALWNPGSGTQTQLLNNSFNNGTNFIYKNSSFAARYRMTGAQHEWYTAPSGTAGNAISFTQAMTLDASGNLVVGATSADTTTLRLVPTNSDTVQRTLHIGYNGSMTSAVSGAYISFGNSTPSTLQLARIASYYEGGTYAGSLRFYTNAGTEGANPSERARITSDGTLITKKRAIHAQDLSGASYAYASPFSATLPISTYYDPGTTYYNYVARLCRFTNLSSGEGRIVGTIYSRGDYNYPYMVAELHFDIAQWSSSSSVYELFAKEFTGQTNIDIALDSSGYVWYYFPHLWTQSHVMVIHYIEGSVELSISNATRHDFTTPLNLVTAGSHISREASWGT